MKRSEVILEGKRKVRKRLNKIRNEKGSKTGKVSKHR